MDRGPHCTGRHAPLGRQPRLGGGAALDPHPGIWGSDMDALASAIIRSSPARALSGAAQQDRSIT
jgi:hypothetical protein